MPTTREAQALGGGGAQGGVLQGRGSHREAAGGPRAHVRTLASPQSGLAAASAAAGERGEASMRLGQLARHERRCELCGPRAARSIESKQGHRRTSPRARPAGEGEGVRVAAPGTRVEGPPRGHGASGMGPWGCRPAPRWPVLASGSRACGRACRSSGARRARAAPRAAGAASGSTAARAAPPGSGAGRSPPAWPTAPPPRRHRSSASRRAARSHTPPPPPRPRPRRAWAHPQPPARPSRAAAAAPLAPPPAPSRARSPARRRSCARRSPRRDRRAVPRRGRPAGRAPSGARSWRRSRRAGPCRCS